MVEDRDIYNFTLTGNWTQVKPLREGSKQLVSRHNNWAIRPDSKHKQGILNLAYITTRTHYANSWFTRVNNG